ncbi:MAG: ABC transporter ATP-binding protein [Micromonosporaceae bacterium]
MRSERGAGAVAEPTAVADAVLDVDDLTTVVRSGGRELPVVRGVSFSVRPGEAVGLVGESGSGKTFTALSVMGLLPEAAGVTGGRIRYLGTDLLTLPERQCRALRGAGIAMIYQDPMTALNPLMAVGAQILEGLHVHGVRGAAARRRMLDALADVGLPRPDRLAARYPHQLSGGQRQRVMIAMALALRPRLLIADEPTTALDATIQQQILALVDELRRRTGLSVLWITHDLGVVARIADRVLVMYAGRIVEQAYASELFARPRHPYTSGLLGSIPPPREAERAPLPQIGGAPPDLGSLPAGCPFQPRCPRRIDRCVEQEPTLADHGGSHAACWAPLEQWR